LCKLHLQRPAGCACWAAQLSGQQCRPSPPAVPMTHSTQGTSSGQMNAACARSLRAAEPDAGGKKNADREPAHANVYCQCILTLNAYRSGQHLSSISSCVSLDAWTQQGEGVIPCSALLRTCKQGGHYEQCLLALSSSPGLVLILN